MNRIMIYFSLLFATLIVEAQSNHSNDFSEVPASYSVEEIFTQAGTTLNDGDTSGAIQLLQSIPVQDTSYLDAQYYLIKIFNNSNNYGQALKAIERYRNKSKSSNDFLIEQKVMALKGIGDTIGALNYVEKELLNIPFNRLNLGKKAELLIQLDRVEEFKDFCYDVLNIYPDHQYIHVLMASNAIDEGKLTEGLIGLFIGLMSDPSSDQASKCIEFIDYLSRPSSFSDEFERNEKSSYKKLDKLLESEIALNDKFEIPSKYQYNICKQIHFLGIEINKLQKRKRKLTRWQEWYEPKFLTLLEEERDILFTTALISSENEQVSSIFKKNREKVLEFYSSIQETLRSNQNPIKYRYLNGDSLLFSPMYFENGNLEYLVEKNKKGEYSGKAIMINNGGKVEGYGSMLNGQLDGNWNIRANDFNDSISLDYKSGELDGKFQRFYSNGQVYESYSTIQNSMKDTLFRYYADGSLASFETYKGGEKTGVSSFFYTNGVEKELNTMEGDFNLVKLRYYNNQISNEFKLKDNVINGKAQAYYSDGSLKIEREFKNGEITNYTKEFYPNGILKEEGKMRKGVAIGEWKYYYANGELKLLQELDERGKLKGTNTYYSIFGNITSVEYYGKNGFEAIESFPNGKSSGKLEIKDDSIEISFYDFKNTIVSVGNYVNMKKEGEWKYYNYDVLKNKSIFKEGNRNGIEESYFDNGVVSSRYQYVNDTLEGPYIIYHKNGQIREMGNNSKGYANQFVYYFYPDGSKKSINFFKEGKLLGKQIYFADNGNIEEIRYFDVDGDLNAHVLFDPVSGEKCDSVFLRFGSGDYNMNYCNGTPYQTTKLVFGKLNGVTNYYYNNGKLKFSCNYEGDELNGKGVGYFPNGNISSTTYYLNDLIEGERITFNYFGDTTSKEYNINGESNGIVNYYYPDGKIKSSSIHLQGDRHGINKLFNSEGDVVVELDYMFGEIVAFIDPFSKKRTVLKNGKGLVKTIYPNGNVAFQCNYELSEPASDFEVFNPNGKHAYYSPYSGIDNRHGTLLYYYPDGQLMETYTFINGVLEGTEESYYPNGNIKWKGAYKNGLKNGEWVYYNEQGEVLDTFIYMCGNFITEK